MSRHEHDAAQLDETLARKYEALRTTLLERGRVAIAFSAGVDSTLLLKVAHDVLGDNVLAVTAASPAVPQREIDEAKNFCAEQGIPHVVVKTHEFDIEGFDHNPPDRCYLCKKEILARIIEATEARGFAFVAEGSNTDDEGDYRPGSQAVRERGVASPLREAGLSKADVRALARHLGLSVWDKPAFACLNTRFAYGDLITPERLAQVDAAEEAVRALGFAHVRVRYEGRTARIEVPPADIERLASSELRAPLVEALKRIGFTYVSLDLQGYRTGSMNETLGQ